MRALVPVVLLATRRPLAWPLAAGAPALGAIGLAGRLAGAGRLAASPPGAAPRSARRLDMAAVAGSAAVRPSPRTPAHAVVWTGSPTTLLHHVLLPLLRSGALRRRSSGRSRRSCSRGPESRRSPALERRCWRGWAAVLALATIAALDSVRRRRAPIDRRRGGARGARRGARGACHEAWPGTGWRARDGRKIARRPRSMDNQPNPAKPCRRRDIAVHR